MADTTISLDLNDDNNFNKDHALNNHLPITKNYKFYCEKCNYGTNINSCFQQHLKTTLHITGTRKERIDKVLYKCEYCSYENNNKNNYLNHKLNMHSDKTERNNKFKHYCECCDFGTFGKTVMDTHNNTRKHMLKSGTYSQVAED